MIQERIKTKAKLMERVRNHPLVTKFSWDKGYYTVLITGTRHWANPEGVRIRREGNDSQALSTLVAKLDELYEKWRMFE